MTDEIRDLLIEIDVTAEEKAKIEAAAARQGINVDDYMRFSKFFNGKLAEDPGD